MIEAILLGFSHVFSPQTLAVILGAVVIGLVVGVLPGLGGAGALAILIPLIYGKDPSVAICFLVGLHAVIYQGGLITSVLFGIPGETASTMTIIDGYPMAKQGRAGRALGNGFMASMLGGIFSGLVLALFLPIAQPIVLAFGSPEYFMLALMGICLVAVLGGSEKGSVNRSLIAGMLGLLLSFVGQHEGTGQLRYTMGSLYLFKGLNVIPVFVGLFALPEVIELMMEGGTIARGEKRLITLSDVWMGCKDCFRAWFLIVRCSTIGVIIGAIPGLGGAVATFMAYGHAKQTSKRSDEFGRGCEEGVIAPESANNAKEGGSYLPTLAFGIPGSSVMVLILGALMVLGIEPGPGMMTEHLDLTWKIVITLILANILGTAICLLAARDLARITYIRSTILVPLIILFIILGAYAATNNPLDVLTAFVFGGIGYLMKIFDYSRVTMTIGFVLGDYAERFLLLSLAGLGPGFLLVSPIAAGLLLLMVFSLAAGGVKRMFSSLNIASRERREV